MSELGVTDEQFVQSCEKASLNPIHKKIVDQIMAVDNFMAFKRLMIKRNGELTNQAAAMLAHSDVASLDKPDEGEKLPESK
jgi:hypothetical protein